MNLYAQLIWMTEIHLHKQDEILKILLYIYPKKFKESRRWYYDEDGEIALWEQL